MGNACPCTTRGLRGHPENYINQGRAEKSGDRTEQKCRKVSQRNCTDASVCVHFSHFRLALTQPIRTFRKWIKSKKWSGLYFIDQRCSSLFYAANLQLSLEVLTKKLWMINNKTFFMPKNKFQIIRNDKSKTTRKATRSIDKFIIIIIIIKVCWLHRFFSLFLSLYIYIYIGHRTW